MQKCTTNRITWIFIILGCISGVYTSCSENAPEVEIRQVLYSNEINIPDLNLQSTTYHTIGLLIKGKTPVRGRPRTELRLLNNERIAVFEGQATLDSLKQKIFEKYKIKVALYLIQNTDGKHMVLDKNKKLVDLFDTPPVVRLDNKKLVVQLYITS